MTTPWRLLLTVAVLAALLASLGCGKRDQAEPTQAPSHSLPPADELLSSARQDFAAQSPIVVNVYLDDSGFSPAIVSVPVGRPLKLVLRNRGTRVHSYRVSDIPLIDNVWFIRESGMSDGDGGQVAGSLQTMGEVSKGELDEHEAHHGPGHMAARPACPQGLSSCAENTVLVEVAPAQVTVVMFAAAAAGRFEISNPSSPVQPGRLVVF